MSDKLEAVKPQILEMSEEDYHADRVAGTPSLSASLCKILCSQTPLHAWTAHPRLNPNFVREEKEIFDLGTVAHALMLQGLKTCLIVQAPDWRTKEAQRMRDDARAQGEIPLLEKHWNRVQAMVGAGKRQIAAHKEAADAFTDGKPEQTLVWTDDHGVVCRARLDWLHNSMDRFEDYKGTGITANPDGISRSMFGAGWDVQDAFYRRGLKAIFGKEATGIFLAQEDFEPYALSVIGMGPDVQCIGDKKVQYAIDLFAKCLDSSKWPGYSDRICYPILPVWQEEMWLRKESEDGL